MPKPIKSPMLAAKRPGGGPKGPSMKKAPLPPGGMTAGVGGMTAPSMDPTASALPPGMKGGGCVKMAKGGLARGFGAARQSANKFKGSR